MLITNIFFFSHNVLKRLFPPVRRKSSLCGNGLIVKVMLCQFHDIIHCSIWGFMVLKKSQPCMVNFGLREQVRSLENK